MWTDMKYLILGLLWFIFITGRRKKNTFAYHILLIKNIENYYKNIKFTTHLISGIIQKFADVLLGILAEHFFKSGVAVGQPKYNKICGVLTKAF